MAGCSVVALMTILTAIAAVMLLGFAAYFVYAYIFESLFCVWQCRERWDLHPAWAWIPLWNQYLLGKAAGLKAMGIALALDHLAVVVLACMAFGGMEPALGWCVIFAALGMIIKAMIACPLYQRACPEDWRKYNWGSILTLGILRPAFLFLLRKRLT